MATSPSNRGSLEWEHTRGGADLRGQPVSHGVKENLRTTCVARDKKAPWCGGVVVRWCGPSLLAA